MLAAVRIPSRITRSITVWEILDPPLLIRMAVADRCTAPLVWLYSSEEYMPYDLGQQLVHTVPEANYEIISGVPNPLTLDNVDQLNALGGTSVYLTSKEGINANPEPAWFAGVKPNAQGKTEGAASCTIIVTDHGDGTVDVFYHYFYA